MKAIVAGMLTVGVCLLVGVGCPDKSKEQQPVAVAPVQPAPAPAYPEPQVQQPEAPPAPTAEAEPAPEPVDRSATRERAPKAKARAERAAPKEGYARERKATRTYTVKKNDTLQKISQKYYGTTKNWQKIYQANKKAIKDPDQLVEGTRLAIP
jgi:5'-nucleotidase / UDP-sugar diphosphatase